MGICGTPPEDGAGAPPYAGFPGVMAPPDDGVIAPAEDGDGAPPVAAVPRGPPPGDIWYGAGRMAR